jgi:type III pantothenate kinase
VCGASPPQPGSDRADNATGGLAPVVLDECATITHHEPAITLIGLRMIFEKNV